MPFGPEWKGCNTDVRGEKSSDAKLSQATETQSARQSVLAVSGKPREYGGQKTRSSN